MLPRYNACPCGLCKLCKLRKRIIPFRVFDANQNRPLRPRFRRFLRAAFQPLVRNADLIHQLALRQAVRPERPSHKHLALLLPHLTQKGCIKRRCLSRLVYAERSHRVKPHAAERSKVHAGKPAVPARVRMYAAHAREPVRIAHKAHIRHVYLA